jgi:hypothetical protein
MFFAVLGGGLGGSRTPELAEIPPRLRFRCLGGETLADSRFDIGEKAETWQPPYTKETEALMDYVNSHTRDHDLELSLKPNICEIY